jgi:hypothetical protein
MSDDIEDDTHDLLVKAFIQYSEANSRFSLFGYKVAAKDARAALNDIAKLVKTRRQEIFKKRVEIHGHERKGIAATTPELKVTKKHPRSVGKG